MKSALETLPPEADTRTRIILTAGRLFHRHGYERTTVRELADAVGLKSGSLFHHFRSKEEILVAVMANGIQSVIDEARALLARNHDPAARLEGMLRLHMHSIISGVGGDAMHAMIYEWRSLSPEAREPIRTLSEAYEQLWHQVIDDAVAHGLARGDPVILRKYLLAGLNSTVRWYRPDGRLAPEAFIQQLRQAALPDLQPDS